MLLSRSRAHGGRICFLRSSGSARFGCARYAPQRILVGPRIGTGNPCYWTYSQDSVSSAYRASHMKKSAVCRYDTIDNCGFRSRRAWVWRGRGGVRLSSRPAPSGRVGASRTSLKCLLRIRSDALHNSVSFARLSPLYPSGPRSLVCSAPVCRRRRAARRDAVGAATELERCEITRREPRQPPHTTRLDGGDLRSLVRYTPTPHIHGLHRISSGLADSHV